jgi:hypothetical protein
MLTAAWLTSLLSTPLLVMAFVINTFDQLRRAVNPNVAMPRRADLISSVSYAIGMALVVVSIILGIAGVLE